MASTGVGELADVFCKRYGNSVRLGEFAGMGLFDRSVGSGFLPKLVGSYESELHPWIGKAAMQSWNAVIDVGYAEDCYAVGSVRLLEKCPKIYALDLTPTTRPANEQIKLQIRAFSSRPYGR
jgi:hypothetical protein